MQRSPNTTAFVALQSGTPVLLYGVSGSGKTASSLALASGINRRLHELVASYVDPLDVHGGPFPSKDGSHIAMLDPQWVHDMVEETETTGVKHILSMDEINRGSHAVLNSFLKIVAEGKVGNTVLPEDTWILGACNPPNLDPDVIELSPAMANRWYHHQWVLPREAVLQGFAGKLRYPTPDFPVAPDNWTDMIGPVGKTIAAFHTKCPGYLELWPDNAAEQAGPWASPRTWEHLVRCLAVAESIGCDRDTAVGAKVTVGRELMEGLVGKVAATALETYLDELDLPDPESLISAAMTARDANLEVDFPEFPGRVDKEIATMGAVQRAIVRDNSRRRWEAAMAMMEVECERKVDVGLLGASSLIDLAPKGAMAPMSMSQKLFPRLMQVLGN